MGGQLPACLVRTRQSAVMRHEIKGGLCGSTGVPNELERCQPQGGLGICLGFIRYYDTWPGAAAMRTFRVQGRYDSSILGLWSHFELRTRTCQPSSCMPLMPDLYGLQGLQTEFDGGAIRGVSIKLHYNSTYHGTGQQLLCKRDHLRRLCMGCHRCLATATCRAVRTHFPHAIAASCCQGMSSGLLLTLMHKR